MTTPKKNTCHVCGKRIYLTVSNGQSSGWVHGEALGVSRMIQVHLACYHEAVNQIRNTESEQHG